MSGRLCLLDMSECENLKDEDLIRLMKRSEGMLHSLYLANCRCLSNKVDDVNSQSIKISDMYVYIYILDVCHGLDVLRCQSMYGIAAHLGKNSQEVNFFFFEAVEPKLKL